MNSLLLAVLSLIGYIFAYKLYGKYLSKRIFRVNSKAVCPSHSCRDDIDFVPTKRSILFGHHFTSISGLGPIVGPAIAIIWGWVPAVLWVILGSIFMGAVHDFGTLIVSLRNQGRSIGDIASDLISPTVRTLFLSITFIGILMVIAVFTLIIAILFNLYPAAVIPVWSEIPIAMLLGYMIYKKKMSHNLWSIIAVILMFIFVAIGAYYPVSMPEIFGLNPLVIWALILFGYIYLTSVLPVTILLQPRDYINGHQLFIVLGLLVFGIIVAQPVFVAPAVDYNPDGAPPMLPFLFIIIACGAISGFHSFVSSGTTSKQCEKEEDALMIGYGGMLLEGLLAIVVIIVVGAAIGMGIQTTDGSILTGTTAFSSHYASWSSASGLAAKLKAFVEGSSNLMGSYGIPAQLSLTIMGVFLVSFALTTLDSATRVQRYVVGEIARSFKVPVLAKPHFATSIAVGTAMILCFHAGFSLSALKKGALVLWPLFSVTNQLLALLALFIVTIYLAKKEVSIKFTAIPALLMFIITGWGSAINIQKFFTEDKMLLCSLAIISAVLGLWISVEIVKTLQSLSQLKKAKVKLKS